MTSSCTICGHQHAELDPQMLTSYCPTCEDLAGVGSYAPCSDHPTDVTVDGGPGALKIGGADWDAADPRLNLHPLDMGPATVAQLDLSAVGFDGESAATSIELTIEDVDDLIHALRAIREDAIANRGFALVGGRWQAAER